MSRSSTATAAIPVCPIFHAKFRKGYELDERDHFHVRSPVLRVAQGENMTVECSVTDFPKAVTEWPKDGILVGKGALFLHFLYTLSSKQEAPKKAHTVVS
uniref:Ig-like domain-containing protein n=1 Tax=Ascaris lumbricoides TaxID=6252 RepID=A0A0M3HYV4_ASCLU